ncbi:MAG: YtxH domain-containing protein [Actinobacteria bacterium]|nr:YtxH domain-containing protein [Actinomycetota bacterium]
MGNKNKTVSKGKICQSVIFTAITAGLSGFFLGLLFAPQTGKNFRRFLARKFLEVVDRSKFAMVEAKVMAEEFIEKSREKDNED